MLIEAGTEVVTELTIKPGYCSCHRITYLCWCEVVTEMHIKAGTEVVTELPIKPGTGSCNRIAY